MARVEGGQRPAQPVRLASELVKALLDLFTQAVDHGRAHPPVGGERSYNSDNKASSVDGAVVRSAASPNQWIGHVPFGRMRVAVFSDVHANIRALRAVCADIERARIEDVWCLGDFASGVGQPAACFDLTMATATVVLAGNHEQFVVERVWTILDGGWARQARLAHAELGSERVERLRALPPHVVLPEFGVELVHGSLADPWSGFVEDTASAEVTLARSSQPLVLVGHTHRAAYFREVGPGALRQSLEIELGREVEIDRTSILNPGAGLDERWLELRLDGGRWHATWHQVGVA